MLAAHTDPRLRARAIFARVHMQATNGVEIKRLNDVLRQKRLPMSREA
jgi:hypothetical protein